MGWITQEFKREGEFPINTHNTMFARKVASRWPLHGFNENIQTRF